METTCKDFCKRCGNEDLEYQEVIWEDEDGESIDATNIFCNRCGNIWEY